MPFPPKTRELHFDYERLLKENVCSCNIAYFICLLSFDQSIRFLQEQMKRERLLLISNKESLEDLERNAHVGEGLSQWQVSLKDCKVLIGLYSKH